jgi:hypothetical protein
MAQYEDEHVVDDFIEIIPEAETTEEDDEDEFEFDDEEGDFIRVDDLGNSVERVVDVLGGIFVSSEGSTVADLFAKVIETLEKHVAAVEAQTVILEKQTDVLAKMSKVLFHLSKNFEKTN